MKKSDRGPETIVEDRSGHGFIRQIKWGLALLILLAGFAGMHALALTAQAAPRAATGLITGRLLNGTKAKAPVGGQSVTLQSAQGSAARDLLTTRTDTRGAFRFSGLDTTKGQQYAVFTRYQGAPYLTGLLDLSSKASQGVDLLVYESTNTTANLAIVQETTLIHEPDSHSGIIAVSEALFFKNVGITTFVGTLDTTQGKPKALFFSLPPGARNVSLTKGFDGSQAKQIDAGFAASVAVPPGSTEFTFSYEIGYHNSTYDFQHTTLYPTVQLSILTPPDLHASSAALSSKGIITADSRPYLLLQGQTFLANNQVHLKLEGLPIAATISNASVLNQGWLWLIVGLIALLAIIVVSSFIYRVFHRDEERAAGKRRRQAAQARSNNYNQKKKGASASESAQDRLLRELAELDKAHEAGKLKKADYDEQRAKLKARLRTVMNEQSGGQADAAGYRKAINPYGKKK